MRGFTALLPFLLLVAASAAEAQRAAPDSWVDADPLSDDPIGVDPETDLSDVEGPPGPEAPETESEIAARGPRPPSVTAGSGEVLTTISAVRETRHDVRISLAEGLAEVAVDITLASRARHPAEVRYRLAVPTGASLATLRVCVEARCRDGHVAGDAGRAAYDGAVRARGPDDAPPIAAAEHVVDARGHAILIHAAPVPSRGSLTISARYLTRAPLIGGVTRMTLPGRGHDPRAAPTTVRVEAPSMIGVSLDDAPAEGALVRDAWYPISVAARLPTGAPTRARIERFRCGARLCARATVTAGPRAGAPVDLVLALDASPSTEGPTRSRIGPAVAAILSAAPRGSRVWALAFGAEARPVVEVPRDPADVPMMPLAEAVGRELGSATRVEKALEVAMALLAGRDGEARTAHLVIVGDGGITRGPEADAAFAEAQRQDIVISVVDVADRPAWAALERGAKRTGGVVIEAGTEAELAARGRGSAELEERVTRLFARELASTVELSTVSGRIVLGALVAGEQLDWEGVVSRRGRLALRGVTGARVLGTDAGRGRALSGLATGDRVSLFAVDAADTRPTASEGDIACSDERGPASRAGGVSGDQAPVALAEPRTCAPRVLPGPPVPAVEGHGRGVPAETVLRMLRQRVRPVARRCFRRDRGGRLDYAVRAEFVIRLQDRELTEARVDGEIDDDLRACLLDAAHDLEVPRFTGAVVVRYPLYTERVARPLVIELVPEVAAEVDSLIPPDARAGDPD